jgi:hypothetical protein
MRCTYAQGLFVGVVDVTVRDHDNLVGLAELCQGCVEAE